MLKRILIYGFPFFLLFVEGVLRAALGQQTNTAVGPSLAATGVGFLIALIVPKPRQLAFSEGTKKELEEKKISVMPLAERHFIDAVWLATFLLTSVWTYCVYLSYKSPTLVWFNVPALVTLGLLNYFVGVVFSEIKERV